VVHVQGGELEHHRGAELHHLDRQRRGGERGGVVHVQGGGERGELVAGGQLEHHLDRGGDRAELHHRGARDRNRPPPSGRTGPPPPGIRGGELAVLGERHSGDLTVTVT
jgi:hypothetical protein